MLEAVPLLARYDTLEPVDILARYDRQSQGWLTLGVLWLRTIAILTALMLLLIAVLIVLTDLISSALTPVIEQWFGDSSGVLLRILFGLVSAGVVYLVFVLGPMRWLINSTKTMRQRVELRLRLLKAIRSHIDRNRVKVSRYWRRTVCRTCLVRFEGYAVRFAYWRVVVFGRCPKCRSDNECYTRVKTIAGWLDRKMDASHEQVGEEVKVNMLLRIPPNSLPLAIGLEELVIAQVEDDDVEILILHYRSIHSRAGLPKPKRLPCRLALNSTASQMSRRQLKESFAFVG